MAKFKPCNEDQLVMLPICLQNQLVPGTLEHTISQVVDKHIDLSVFDARYNNNETGATAIHPKILLKVILFGYAKGMISSRQIERACQENILFIALSYGYAPDHSTIAQFISSMQSEIEILFCNVLLVCEELGLLDGTHFSLDGVKLSANVSKEWSGTLDELIHKRDKLQEKLQRVIAEHAQADKQPEVVMERQKKRERRFQLQVERLNEFLKDRNQNAAAMARKSKVMLSTTNRSRCLLLMASSRDTTPKPWSIPNIRSFSPRRRSPARITNT
jgi:transposase